MKNIIIRSKVFLSQGHSRDRTIKKNVLGLAVLKGVSIIVGLALVPLSLHYLEPTKYGIWLTLSSIIAWMGFFNIGLSNGLRNKLGEALAQQDQHRARVLVSTTLAILICIIAVVYALFWLINPFLNWTAILNAPSNMAHEINLLVIIVFSCFALRFVTDLIFTVLVTDQRTALADSFNVLGSVLSLAVIYVLTLTTKNSLLYLGASLSAITALVPLVASVWFFRHDYSLISPSRYHVDLTQVSGLAGQGIQFFLLQIASLILTMTDLFIIAQLYGPSDVVTYSIAYKLFAYVIVVFGILANPLWSAYNEAFNMQDLSWIKNATKKVFRVWCLFALGIIILIALSDVIYRVWIGDKVVVPVTLSIFMGLYAISQTLNSIFAVFVFSTGKLRVLTYMAIVVSLINIPLCIFFAKILGLRLAGIILATVVCTLLNLLFGAVQFYKLTHGTARGIWAR